MWSGNVGQERRAEQWGLNLHAVGARFESRLEQRLSGGLGQSLQANAVIGHGSSFQILSNPSSYHSTQYSLDAGNVIK
jgi:hypothetical protein